MNLLQAIEQAGDNWFRPVSMSGRGSAYSFDNGQLEILVKNSRYGVIDSCPTLPKIYLTGEWEIVTPEQVMEERKHKFQENYGSIRPL